MAQSPDPGVIGTFSNAIAQGEGYGVNPNNLPTRSNNPGDINNTGSATQSYASAEAGWSALDQQVMNAFTGQSSKYNPNMTVAEFGAVYAPSGTLSENLPGILGVPPDTTLAQIASKQVAVKSIPRPAVSGSSTGSNGPAGSPEAYTGVDDSDPAAAISVSGSTQAVTQDDIDPPLSITAGLDETPWFSDPNILQVDGATKAVPTPVRFAVYFNLNSSPLPVVIKLNASLQQFGRGLRHLSNRHPTRTGLLVTLWGMQPDIITGAGSTGVFMNQLGLTDFLSLSNINSDVQNLIKQGWGYVENQQTDPTKTTDLIMKSDSGSTSVPLTAGSMRIAAKDAFMEFLMLFKNNGIVWFQSPHSTGDMTSENQLGPNAWSPATGSSTFQNGARRNDVMTRGAVAMYFRNSVYYGYFTNFTWVEDAKKPFNWNFNFSFQVERTVTTVGIPDLSQ